jgi:hypothetical protein
VSGAETMAYSSEAGLAVISADGQPMRSNAIGDHPPAALGSASNWSIASGSGGSASSG